jgi:bifunctional non-homologous end joining protein LigD
VVPPAFPDADGQDLLVAAGENGLEGVMAKRNTSVYEPGRRSHAWVKVPLWKTQEVVLGGWRPGEGRRSGTIGSLLLGVPDDGGLTYVGHVGTGFNAAVLADLLGRLTPLEQRESPFSNEVPRDRARGAHWVRPELVGEVEFRTLTRDGRLRHSTWRGLRADKRPEDVGPITPP